MKVILLIIGIFVSSSIYAIEDCSLDALNLSDESNMAEQLFYTGTCHYRNKNYDKAVKTWEQLAKLNLLEQEDQNLQSDVLNNLGYLIFFGLGVERDQSKAISYWKKAITMGQTESEYHLCHAFADKKQSTYNRKRAKKHCHKALLIYRGMEPKDQEILSMIESYYADVK